MKDCCHRQLFARSVRIWLGKQTDTDRFTCGECGQSHHRDAHRIWQPVSALEDLREMVNESGGVGHLTEDE